MFSIGQFLDTEETKAIRFHDEFSGIYKKVVIKDNKVIGAVLFGDTSDSSRLMKMFKEETDISGLDKTDFLNDAGANGTTTSTGVADMSDDEIICGCNGVSKGTICTAIQEQGLATVEDV